MRTVDFTQHIAGSADAVWERLTNPTYLREWLRVADATIELRPGGRFHCVWDFGGISGYRVRGTVLEVDAPRLLRVAWPLPDADSTVVQFTIDSAFYGLERDYGGSDLRVLHDGFAESGRGRFEFDGHNRHWRQGIGELAAALEGRPGKPRPGAVAGLVFVGGVPGEGLLVRDVIVGSPAANAGIEPGDLIRAVDGQPLGALDDFHAWVDHRAAGDTGVFMVNDRTTSITLAAPEDIAAIVERIRTATASK